MNHDRINLRLLSYVLPLAFAACLAGNSVCLAGDTQDQGISVEFDSFEDVENIEAGSSPDGETETGDTKRARGFRAIKNRIKNRLVEKGASDQDAEDVADNVADSVCEDCCPGGCTIKQDQSGWLWRRNKEPDRWYPGKAIGESAVEAKDWVFFGIRFAFWSAIAFVVGVPLVVVIVVSLIIYALFRKK